MKVFTIAFCLLTISLNSFALEEESYELESIDHEMFLGCVSSKSECKTLAHHEGFNTSKVVKDPSRCVDTRKALACIVKH